MLHRRTGPLQNIREMLADLSNDRDQWYFASLDGAARFAATFRRIDEQIMADFSSALMYRAVGDCLCAALAGAL